MGYPSFSVGDVLTANDMNAVGLWRVTGCTVSSAGGTAATASNGVVTIGTNNTSVTVSNAFSADYESYIITITGGVASVGCALGIQLGSTTTNYSYSFIYNGYTNTTTGLGTTTGANFVYAGAGTTTSLHMYAVLTNPQLAENTYCMASSVNASWAGTLNGYLTDTTQYTAFTIVPSTGNLTGGKIRVYGFRN